MQDLSMKVCLHVCAWRDLNPRHSVPKTDALSTELQAHTFTDTRLAYYVSILEL